MAIFNAVSEVIESLPESDQDGWQAQLALQLAASLDETPNASMARELRSLMKDIESNAIAVEEDALDKIIDLAAKRKSAS